MPRFNIDGSVDSYKISDIDESGATKYYGYLDRYSNWYILAMTDTTARYCRGSNSIGYIVNWNNKTNLSYTYFNEAFTLGGGQG